MSAESIRTALMLCGFAWLWGCHSPAESVSVVDVQRRLAVIERDRLTHDSPQAAPARFALMSESHTGQSDGDAPATLWLADFASEQPAGGAAPDDDALAAERVEKWGYRPLLPTFKENAKRDLKTMAPDLWRDTKRVYANPVNLAILGASYGGALAVQQTGPDKTVENHYDKHHTFSKGWRDAFGALGNPGTHFAFAGAMYLVGEQIQDEKTYQVSKALFSALIINGLSTMVGQTATWDRSPNGEWGTFPSGHTSSSFCFATVMNEAYGPLVGIPLYGLGTLVAIERLDDREHYMSDVLFGAVLGTVVGHSVATGRDPEFFGWKVLPYVDPAQGVSGVAFMKQYK